MTTYMYNKSIAHILISIKKIENLKKKNDLKIKL